MIRSFFLLIGALIFLNGCDPCSGCGPITYEPTVALRFVDVELNDNNEPVQTAMDSVNIYIPAFDSVFWLPNHLTRMRLPLSITEELTDYEVELTTGTYTFSLTYALSRELDVDHRMLIRALDIELINHSFDSLSYTCGFAGCLDKQTQITCYY